MWGRDKEIGEIKSHRWKYFKSEIKLNNDGATTLVRLQSHRWTRESHDLQMCELHFCKIYRQQHLHPASILSGIIG